MYRTINDFTEDWRRETASTAKIYRALTDASLAQKVTPDGRSLGFLAWHIIVSVCDAARRSGLKSKLPTRNDPMPVSASALAEVYIASTKVVGDEIGEHWNDASLLEEVEMFGEKWRRGFALSAMMRHQTHHRGQMTVLMRQAALTVPGVCGPAKEEWATMGMPALQ